MAAPSTARRLFFAFGALVLLFAAAAALALWGQTELERDVRDMRAHGAAVRDALELATAVRDQYAHQAHTIILGNTSHLDRYDEARARVQRLTAAARLNARDEQERAFVDDIERLAEQLDRVFQRELVPAVVAGESGAVLRLHGRAQQLVSDIQDRADRLGDALERSMARAEQRADQVRRRTFALTLSLWLLAALFALGVGVYIARSVARPVARLTAGAARLAEGDLSVRLALPGDDELARLGRQFDAMTCALLGHQERLVQTERLAGVGRLAAGVAHEINNPLGVILGYARVLQKKAEGSAREDLTIIADEALRCQEIVEGLLDLARPLQADDRAVDLRALCDETVARLVESGALASGRVSIEGLAHAPGSGARLRQVLFNLLKNAAEASPPEGRVAVRLSQEPAQAVVAVSDEGPGVAPEAQGRLFEPFFTTKAQGTGLGLAVSRAIAQVHGGSLEHDAAVTSGATFVLRLPSSSAAKEA